MVIMDGNEKAHESYRISRGIHAQMGYRRVTQIQGPVTKIFWRKINESDIPGLVGIITDGEFGEIPSNPTECSDLRDYLVEKYSK